MPGAMVHPYAENPIRMHGGWLPIPSTATTGIRWKAPEANALAAEGILGRATHERRQHWPGAFQQNAYGRLE